MRMTYTWGHSV